MEDEIYEAMRDLDTALNRIRSTGAGKATAGLEVLYGNAYQRLVRAGARVQLRGKYRA